MTHWKQTNERLKLSFDRLCKLTAALIWLPLTVLSNLTCFCQAWGEAVQLLVQAVRPPPSAQETQEHASKQTCAQQVTARNLLLLPLR